jgi:hypothetical protein
MMHCPGTGIEDKKGRDEAVSEPDADPCLPPRQTGGHHRGDDHPGVDVETIGHPEGNEVPVPPCTILRWDGAEVIIL